MYLLLIAIAAFFYSVNHTVAQHYATSVFQNLNPNFWNAAVSSTKAKKLFGSYPWDAYHISASLMIIFFSLAVVLNQHPFWVWEIKLLKWYYQLAAIGLVWIVVFDLFYSKFLYRAPKTPTPPAAGTPAATTTSAAP